MDFLTPFNKNRPIIAAHRGLSSIYPENTTEGFLAAFQFADFVELDVLLSKDHQLIVCHDGFLSRLTDIEKYPQYLDRRCKRTYKGKEQDDWWAIDFTYDELAQLRVHQVLLKRKSDFDWQLSIPTLKSVLESVLAYNRANNTKKGILLEIKEDVYHKTYVNQEIAAHVYELLQSLNLLEQTELPLALMAFDASILKYLEARKCKLPLVQLLRQTDAVRPTLEDIVGYAHMIGVDLKLLWDNGSTGLAEQAQKMGLKVFGWTFQDDNEEIKQALKNENMYLTFKFLDGYITEFPQEAIKHV